jgi:protein SCO1
MSWFAATMQKEKTVSHPLDGQRIRKMIIGVFACMGFLAGCGPSRSAKQADAKVATQADDASVKRYTLIGRVVSVDKADQSLTVDGDAIPGFMSAMTMPYQVKDAGVLGKLSPGDQIKADIVVANEGAYLENIVLAPKPASPNPVK